MLIGPYRSLIKSPAIVSSLGAEAYGVTYVGGEVSSTDTDTYTFTNAAAHFDFGAEASNRAFLMAVCGRWGTASDPTIASATIGGEAATVLPSGAVAFAGGGGGYNRIAFYEVTIPTGADGDVVVTWDQTMLRCGIDLWRIAKVATAACPTPVTANAQTSAEITPVIPTDGNAIVAVYGVQATAWGWTNATEETGSDVSLESTTNRKAAAKRSTAGSTAITATATGGNTDILLIAAAYGP